MKRYHIIALPYIYLIEVSFSFSFVKLSWSDFETFLKLLQSRSWLLHLQWKSNISKLFRYIIQKKRLWSIHAQTKSITQWKCISGHPFTNEQLLQRWQTWSYCYFYFKGFERKHRKIVLIFTGLIQKQTSHSKLHYVTIREGGVGICKIW